MECLHQWNIEWWVLIFVSVTQQGATLRLRLLHLYRALNISKSYKQLPFIKPDDIMVKKLMQRMRERERKECAGGKAVQWHVVRSCSEDSLAYSFQLSSVLDSHWPHFKIKNFSQKIKRHLCFSSDPHSNICSAADSWFKHFTMRTFFLLLCQNRDVTIVS